MNTNAPLFLNLKTHFESLTFFEDFISSEFILSWCATLLLKRFVEKIPELFQYRKALLDQLKNEKEVDNNMNGVCSRLAIM